MDIGTGPWVEDQRLAALHALRILDTPAEPAFERIVEIGRRVFNAPIVLVSLVDGDRQWFKARCGLDADQTVRSVSFCSHAIEVPSNPFVILDASKDARFRENPLVTGPPYIRFYAGAVIRSTNGAPVGTVCIIAPTPRGPLSEQEAADLVDLAAVASDELQFREARLALEASIASLRSANEELSRLIRRNEEELRFAAEIQRRNLPSSHMRCPGLTATSILLPSRGVSGDVFGYGALNAACSYFWIADVSGHGVAAALLASSLSRILTGELLQESANHDVMRPAKILEFLNRRMALEDNGDMYFTAVYGVYHSDRRRLCFANAGHPGPLSLSRDGSVHLLEGAGLPIGLFADVEFEDFEIELPPRCRILIHSDGVIDALDADGLCFGEERLRDWYTSSSVSTGTEALGNLERDLRLWSGHSPSDDATAIILEIE